MGKSVWDLSRNNRTSLGLLVDYYATDGINDDAGLWGGKGEVL
jgi:hypothetical protein